jgi:hypothetical protein
MKEKTFQQIARKYILDRYHVRSNLDVKMIPGDHPPKCKGSGWYYVTAGGSVIDHPSAYRAKGWSNMYYVPSTYHIEVGENWTPTMG